MRLLLVLSELLKFVRINNIITAKQFQALFQVIFIETKNIHPTAGAYN
jgi:hypothetical protein